MNYNAALQLCGDKGRKKEGSRGEHSEFGRFDSWSSDVSEVHGVLNFQAQIALSFSPGLLSLGE